MTTEIRARLKRIAKLLAALCAIELLLPGGTLIALGYLLTVHRRAHASGEGEPAIWIWAGVRRGTLSKALVAAIRPRQTRTIACRVLRRPADLALSRLAA